MLSSTCDGLWADVNQKCIAWGSRSNSFRPLCDGRHRCCSPSWLPKPRHDCRYLCGLQQTCRKIIVHRVKIRNDAGKLRRTVTRCNNRSKRSGIYVSSPSQKKKIAVGQLTLYYWHIALGPSIRKQSVALIYGCRGRSSDRSR